MSDSAILPAETSITSLTLRVRNLTAQVSFYSIMLGLDILESSETGAQLGRDDLIVSLEHDAEAAEPTRISTGMYHAAILLPDRHALAATIARIAQANYPLEGAADHGVSEAFYLADPEHNGIELYRDLPRSEWRYSGDEIIMVSDPVDQEGIFATLTPGEPIPRRAPAGTRLGHLHLQVDDLGKAREFYGRVLGFEPMASMPGALFMSAGGYHHHLGFNTWRTAGAPLATPHATGLTGFSLSVPAGGAEALKSRLDQHAVDYDSTPEGLWLLDPWRHELRVGFSAGNS